MGNDAAVQTKIVFEGVFWCVCACVCVRDSGAACLVADLKDWKLL